MDKLYECATAYHNRKKTFEHILNGTITYDFISQSRYFHVIERRFEPLSHFETILDKNKLVFRYNNKKNVFSLIDADYLLSTSYNNLDMYIFIAETQKSGIYFCRSFFPKEDRDYTAGQMAYTLLYKEKINLITEEATVQYDRLTSKNCI